MTPGTLVDGGVELHVDLLDLLVAGRPALLAALFFSLIHICALASSKTGRRRPFLKLSPHCARVNGLHVLVMLGIIDSFYHCRCTDDFLDRV